MSNTGYDLTGQVLRVLSVAREPLNAKQLAAAMGQPESRLLAYALVEVMNRLVYDTGEVQVVYREGRSYFVIGGKSNV